jgi:hypothetical protein
MIATMISANHRRNQSYTAAACARCASGVNGIADPPRPGHIQAQPGVEGNIAHAKVAGEGLDQVQQKLSRQVPQHDLAGFFGLSAHFKGRADNPHSAPVLMDRPPRRHEAVCPRPGDAASVKAGTAAALITITNEKPLLLAFQISMSSTGPTTRLNCKAIPFIGESPIEKPPSPNGRSILSRGDPMAAR